MQEDFAEQVHKAIVAVCPIHGISIGRKNAKETWRIDFEESATEAQKQAALEAIRAFTYVMRKKELS